MTTRTRALLPALVTLLAFSACADAPTQRAAAFPIPGSAAVVGESQARIVVDAGRALGPVMRLERATTHSTSSPLPGEPTRDYMQGLEHDVVRTWIQTRYVYNNGDIDYNYRYESSGVGAEDALAFYATTAKSVLIALSAYNPTSRWSMPTGDALTEFLTRTLVYYKSRYPNIRYVQVGNEPDANRETMATYYPIYTHYYRAVNAANAELGLDGDDRLLLSNGPLTSNVANMLRYADGFLAAYAADPDPAKKLDFFSFHSYGETNRPAELLTARARIDAAMAKHGLPSIPVFVSEYGMFGGSSLPVRMTLAQLMTMQPAGQFTKAFYLYEGGIDGVFNWAIHHRSLPSKSQVANVATGTLYPYGNALELAKKVSDRGTRIEATSKAIRSSGLGTHVLASMAPGKGIAILVWNFNWRDSVQNVPFDVLVKNVPHAAVGGQRVTKTVYIIDSRNNNYFTNPAQDTLEVTSREEIEYSPTISIPMQLERHAVALILLEHARGKPPR